MFSTSRCSALGPLAVAGAILFSSPVLAGEFRRLEFQDGREWLVDLKGSDVHGMLVEIPQGEAQVSYDDIRGIHEISPKEYEAAKPWKIRLLAIEAGGQEALIASAKALRSELIEEIQARPGMRIQGKSGRVTPGIPGVVPDDCGIRSAVSLSTEAGRGVDYVVSAFLVPAEPGTASLLVCGQFTRGSQPIQRWSSEVSADTFEPRRGLSAVLGLIHPAEFVFVAPEEQEAPTPSPLPSERLEAEEAVTSTPLSPQPASGIVGEPQVAQGLEPGDSEVDGPDLRRLAFVPLPGFPSLYVRDMSSFGRAWLAAVPLSVAAGLWINGDVAFRSGQRLFLTTAAYYVITVGTNQYMARQSGVLPDDRFGAAP